MESTAAAPGLPDVIRRVLDLDDPLACRVHLQSELERLGEGRATVVVVGAFKRGKSTLLNALIGRDILPTGVVPVTALVTLVRAGLQDRVLLDLGEDGMREVPVDDLGTWVSQSENPDNVRGVRRVVVELADLPGDHPLVLADTPGTGSVFRRNTEVLRNWLGQIDAALFVVSSDPPVGEEDLSLLRDVAEASGEVVVVLNKIDRLRTGELEESMAYTRRAVESVLGEGARIVPCSARRALERGPAGTGVDDLAGWISELAGGRADLVLERAVARRVARSLSREITLVSLERQAAERNADLIETALHRLDALAVELGERLAEVTAAFRDGCQRLMREYDDAARTAAPEIVEGVAAALRESASSLGRSGAGRIRFRRELESARDRHVRTLLEPIQIRAESRVRKGFGHLTARALRRVDELVDEAYDTAASTFDISIEHFDITEEFRMESRLEYRVGLPRVNLDAIAEGFLLLLPSSLGRRAFLRRHLSQLPDAIDRQLGLIRADLWERLRESAFSFEGELGRKVEEALRRLRAALNRGAEIAHESAEEAQVHMTRLEERLAILDRAHEVCQKVLSAAPGVRDHPAPEPR